MDVTQPAVYGRLEANPLLRAGLALAGVNRPQAGQNESADVASGNLTKKLAGFCTAPT
jgi:hypothetical protein